jgi:hypothetical protein
MYCHQLVHNIEVQCNKLVLQYYVRVGGNTCYNTLVYGLDNFK